MKMIIGASFHMPTESLAIFKSILRLVHFQWKIEQQFTSTSLFSSNVKEPSYSMPESLETWHCLIYQVTEMLQILPLKLKAEEVR